jgi:nicotinamidase-related amidase
MTDLTLGEHAGLIVVDLQQGTLSQQLSAPADIVLGHGVRLVQAFHARKLPVALITAHAMPAGRTTYGGGARPLPPGWDTLAPQLGEQEGDIRISKSAWSSFTGTDLDARLRELGVTEVVIIGLATSFGVESTARSAYDLGYDVVIASDAIADVSPAGHESSLARVFPTLARIGSTEEIVAGLGA